MWHVSSRSGVATLRTGIHLLLTYFLTYLLDVGGNGPTDQRCVTNSVTTLAYCTDCSCVILISIYFAQIRPVKNQ